MSTSHYMTTLIFTLLLTTPMSASGNNETNDMEKKITIASTAGTSSPT